MADRRELVEYLRTHRGEFTLERLRAGLLEQGEDAAELDAAILEVSAEKPRPRLRSWLFYALAAAFPVFWAGYNFLPRPRKAAPAAADAAKAEVEAEAAAGAGASAALPPLEAARARYHKDFFDPYAHVELADELYKSGLLEDSFYVLEEARGFFPKEEFEAAHGFVIVGRHGGGWPGGGRFDPSPGHEAALKARAAADPRDWESLSYLAHIAGHNGDHAAAEAYADRALKLAPDELGPLGLKAHLLAKSDAGASLAAFEKVFALAPDSPDGRGALEIMTSLAAQGKRGGEPARRALKDLVKALADRPDDAEVYLGLAFAHGAAGDVKGVRRLVREADEARPGSSALYAVKGLLAIEDKRVREAVALLEKALARDPGSPYALEKLAQLHRKDLKDMSGALPYYVALHRQNPHYYDGEFAEDRIKRELARQRAAAVASAANAQDARRLMSSSNGATRAEACLLAGKLGDPAVIGALADRLDDEVGGVVQNADNALYQLSKSKPSEIAAAREKIVNDPRAFVRGMALNLYCDLDKPGMRATALERLSDPDAYVRFRAHMAVAGYYAADAEAQIARGAALEKERDPGLLKALRFLEERRGSR